jgi:hypothetical protein
MQNIFCVFLGLGNLPESDKTKPSYTYPGRSTVRLDTALKHVMVRGPKTVLVSEGSSCVIPTCLQGVVTVWSEILY